MYTIHIYLPIHICTIMIRVIVIRVNAAKVTLHFTEQLKPVNMKQWQFVYTLY